MAHDWAYDEHTQEEEPHKMPGGPTIKGAGGVRRKGNLRDKKTGKVVRRTDNAWTDEARAAALEKLRALHKGAIHPDIKTEHLESTVRGVMQGASAADAKHITQGMGFAVKPKSIGEAVKMVHSKIAGAKGSFERAFASTSGPQLSKDIRAGAESRPEVMAALPKAKETVATHVSNTMTRNLLARVYNWLTGKNGDAEKIALMRQLVINAKHNDECDDDENDDDCTDNANPRHVASGQWRPKFGKSDGAHEAAAQAVGTPGFGGGTGKATLEREEQDDDDDNDIDDLASTQADDHQNPKFGPDELKAMAKKLGIKNVDAAVNQLLAENEDDDMRTLNQPPTNPGFPPAAPVEPSTQHAVSQQALGATAATGDPDALKRAQAAHDASVDNDPHKAAIAHLKASQAHSDAADGDDANKDDHNQAAALHRKAAMMHQATLNKGKNMRVYNQPGHSLSGVDRSQQQAAFAAMAEDSGSSAARSASAKAKESGTKSAHMAAAKAHKSAAAGHEEAAEKHGEAGREDEEKSHTAAAAYHEKKASFHKGKATMNELAEIAANCKDPATKAALQALNAKPDSSNADATGSGDFDDADIVGGEDDDDDSDTDYEDKAKKQVSGKPKGVENWLSSAPPEVRSVVEKALGAEKDAKLKIVKKLISNVKGSGNRNRVGATLMAMDIRDLQSMSPVSSQRPQPVFLGAGGSDFAANAIDEYADDVLDTPTLNFSKKEVS